MKIIDVYSLYIITPCNFCSIALLLPLLLLVLKGIEASKIKFPNREKEDRDGFSKAVSILLEKHLPVCYTTLTHFIYLIYIICMYVYIFNISFLLLTFFLSFSSLYILAGENRRRKLRWTSQRQHFSFYSSPCLL